MSASLIAEAPIQLYDYDKQKALFRNAYKQKLSVYGNTMAIKVSEVFGRDGMHQRGRFWELIFSLQQEGLIRIAGFGYSGKYSEINSVNGQRRVENKDEPFVSFEGGALHGNNLSIIADAPGRMSPDGYREYTTREALRGFTGGEAVTSDSTVRYDSMQKLLMVGGTEIPIAGNNQPNLCRTLLCSSNNYARVWGRDEVLEEWGWLEDRIYDSEGRLLEKNLKVVYTAARGVNDAVLKATNGNILGLFKFDTKSVSIDPKYQGRLITGS